jgi:class 3 adenylate cyclase
VAKLTAKERATLPDRAFAYIDSKGRRRLPIHDEAHVRNALARFDRVPFEDDAARERARRRLLNAAKRFKIVPVGFITSQLRSERGSLDFDGYPTGTVTFLMTDIEGSTRLLERMGDDYPALLKEVRSTVRNAVRREGGHRVDSHGDEVLSVFSTAGPAVRAAVAIHLALAERRWPKDVQCKVRAGIHTGRTTLTDSGYVGLVVNTVARIGYVGHGGQIIVSGATRTALGRGDAGGARLRSIGRHRLAGLSEPVSLFQVYAEGLAERFPPLRLA